MTYQIRVDPEARERWEAAAKADHRTLADWMRARLDEAAAREAVRSTLRARPA